MSKKRGCLGFSLPVAITVAVLLFALIILGLLAGPIGQSFGIHLPEWMVVPSPHPELPAETVFHIGSFAVKNSMIAMWITILFLVLFSWAVTRRMKIIPGRLQSVFESILGWVYDLCCSVAGPENGRRFFPIVATIFLVVAFNAWFGLIPGFGSITIHTEHGVVPLIRPANTDLNTPLAIALVSWVFVWVVAFRSVGIKYLKEFFNFKEFNHAVGMIFKGKVGGGMFGLFTGVINIFTGLLELLANFIRIISLTFRLFGNMTAGEILLLVISFLLPFVVPVVFYGLELLIGFIQALIFSGLTLIYVTVAVTPHEEEAH